MIKFNFVGALLIFFSFNLMINASDAVDLSRNNIRTLIKTKDFQLKNYETALSRTGKYDLSGFLNLTVACNCTKEDRCRYQVALDKRLELQDWWIRLCVVQARK